MNSKKALVSSLSSQIERHKTDFKSEKAKLAQELTSAQKANMSYGDLREQTKEDF